MPERIQVKRSKGWRMPEGAVYVGRPTKWGNPYRIGRVSGTTGLPRTAADVVDKYRVSLHERSPELIEMAKTELRGRDLACWCRPGAPCHADVLLEIANA